MSEALLILYDRDCGICAAVATHLRRWDRDARLELLALQDAGADRRAVVREVARRHPLHDELHVVEPETGRVRSGGRAVLEITSRLPGGRMPAALAGLLPTRWAIGVGYALVARNRHSISRALRLKTACRV
jgi:predicted DCC family thiol-disulfide oxidoreductase YuxK